MTPTPWTPNALHERLAAHDAIDALPTTPETARLRLQHLNTILDVQTGQLSSDQAETRFALQAAAATAQAKITPWRTRHE